MDNQENKSTHSNRKVNGALRLSRDSGIDVDITHLVLHELLKERTEIQIFNKEES